MSQKLLKSVDLKNWLHRDVTPLDKLLLVLATFDEAVQLASIRERAKDAGFRIPKSWNESQILNRSKGKAIRTSGWELTDSGKAHLRDLGVSKISPAAMQVAVDLREHATKISNAETRAFIEEAITCHEFELFRAAIVMSWLGAVDVLHKHVLTNCLTEFNAEAYRAMGKRWKKAATSDDLGKMKEGDFLDRLEGISAIGKTVKARLKVCLDLRNGCGHPNTLKVSANQSAAHIEALLQNVFEPFST